LPPRNGNRGPVCLWNYSVHFEFARRFGLLGGNTLLLLAALAAGVLIGFYLAIVVVTTLFEHPSSLEPAETSKS
jgi:hypothetical protein